MNFRLIVATAVLLLVPDVRAQPVRLPSFNVALDETSVSGLSSGGYMAVQFHVANSAVVKGSGVVAGGPYFCARDDQTAATTVCSCASASGCQPGRAAQLVPELIQKTDQNAQQGAIDPTTNLSRSRVWLFSGSLDSTVQPPVMSALATYYEHYVPAANIAFSTTVAAEHAMPTDSFGNSCGFRGDPFINDCDLDAAGELLAWIYGSLNARRTGALSGEFIEFDQGEFLEAPTAHGMWQTGWIYAPASCRANARCRVHIVFHGCKQYPGFPYAQGPQGKFGDTYVKNTGYVRWADTNGIVVLFPQANAMTAGTRLPRFNPVGCWDWWGYDDGSYARKTGRQMAAVRKMLDRLAGQDTGPVPRPPGFCGAASNAEHVAASRATYRFLWLYFARGSNDFLGFGGSTETTLQETSPGSYRKVASCP